LGRVTQHHRRRNSCASLRFPKCCAPRDLGPCCSFAISQILSSSVRVVAPTSNQDAATRSDRKAMELTLTADQAEILREVLDSTLREIRYEIADTDRPDFKRKLKDRETILRELLAPLGGPLPDAPISQRAQ
jgi:hypothetical protein